MHETKNNAEPSTRWVTAKECAEYFSLSVEFIRRLTQAGEIPAMKIRGLSRYDLEEVERTFLSYDMPSEDSK